MLRERPGLVSLALVAGAVLPVQGAINALLRADIGAPLAVGFTSFIVATLSMLAFLPIAKRFLGAHAPDFRGLEAMPRWGWLGGLAGAFYVTTVFTTLPAIGAASVVALTVAGQQAASVLVDRFGLLGFATRPISVQRLAGVALLFVGVLLVQIA